MAKSLKPTTPPVSDEIIADVARVGSGIVVRPARDVLDEIIANRDPSAPVFGDGQLAAFFAEQGWIPCAGSMMTKAELDSAVNAELSAIRRALGADAGKLAFEACESCGRPTDASLAKAASALRLHLEGSPDSAAERFLCGCPTSSRHRDVDVEIGLPADAFATEGAHVLTQATALAQMTEAIAMAIRASDHVIDLCRSCVANVCRMRVAIVHVHGEGKANRADVRRQLAAAERTADRLRVLLNAKPKSRSRPAPKESKRGRKTHR